MTNGPETHEWRIGQLELRMNRLEDKIQRAMYALIGNLIGIILLLASQGLRWWTGHG